MQSCAVQWVLGGTLFPLSCLSHSSESSRHSPLNPLNVLPFALPSTDTVPLPGLTLAAWSALLSALPSLASVLPLANTQVGYSAAPPTPHHTTPTRTDITAPHPHDILHPTGPQTAPHCTHTILHTTPSPICIRSVDTILPADLVLSLLFSFLLILHLIYSFLLFLQVLSGARAFCRSVLTLCAEGDARTV